MELAIAIMLGIFIVFTGIVSIIRFNKDMEEKNRWMHIW